MFQPRKLRSSVGKIGASNGLNSLVKAVVLLTFIALNCIFKSLPIIKQNMAVPVEPAGKLYN